LIYFYLHEGKIRDDTLETVPKKKESKQANTNAIERKEEKLK